MCLALYIGSNANVPLFKNEDISVQSVDDEDRAVCQWFSVANVRYVGAPGCSCAFPSVVSQELVEWYPGIFEDVEDREAELASVRALVDLVNGLVAESGEVQMYPVWSGEEGESPKGVVNILASSLDVETFFFNERFFYKVTGGKRQHP